METQTGNPQFPSILALLSCIFTSLYVVPLPSLLPCRRGGTRVPPPQLPCTPFERDKISLADSDTTMRPMRPPSALENPSPATTLPPSSHPFPLLFRHSPDTNLPRMRQGFPSWFRYNNETMRQISATKTSPQLRSLSRQLRTRPLAPCFHSYEKPPNATTLPKLAQIQP